MKPKPNPIPGIIVIAILAGIVYTLTLLGKTVTCEEVTIVAIGQCDAWGECGITVSSAAGRTAYTSTEYPVIGMPKFFKTWASGTVELKSSCEVSK